MSDSRDAPDSLRELIKIPGFANVLFQTAVFQGQRLSEIFIRSWLALELTESGVAVGAIGVAQTLPTFLFCLVAGAAIEKWPKHHVLVGTSLVSVAANALIAYLAWAGDLTLVHLLVSSATFGAVLAFAMPARHTIVAEIVGVRNLMPGMASLGMVSGVSRIAFPAVIGLVLAISEPYVALTAIAILSGVTLVASMLLPSHRTAHAETPLLPLIMSGLRNLASDSRTVALVLANTSRTALGRPHRLLPLFAPVWGVSSAGIGVAFAAAGIFNLVGSTQARLIPLSARGYDVAFLLLAVLGAGIAAFAASPWMLLALMPLAVASACDSMSGVAFSALMQANSPDFRGRNISLLFGLEEAAESFFALPLAVLAELLSPQLTFVIAGVLLSGVAFATREMSGRPQVTLSPAVSPPPS